jgi:moderate conductance mechanosensitive channel
VGRWWVGAIGLISGPICAACLLIAALLLGAPRAHAASGPAASSPAASGDVSELAGQARALLRTPQGATLLDLLGDPAVRERLMAAPIAPPPPTAMTGSMGFMLDRVLGLTRQRIIDLGTQLRALPDALRACWGRVSATMPASDTFDMLIYLVAFVAGGFAAQRLFMFAARPWLAHFDHHNVATLQHRLAVLVERLAFGILLLGAFAAGSMGTFLLFSWPASSGSMILGYLGASLMVRLGNTVSRFFLAPGAERLRLVPLTTRRAWFWHRWIWVLTAIGALGWQTIEVLRGLGLPSESLELLRQILLLVLALCGIAIVWTPRDSETLGLLSPRRAAFRGLISFALLLTWLLFLTQATNAALSLLGRCCMDTRPIRMK